MILHRNLYLLKWFNFFLDFRPYTPIAILYFSEVSGSFALGLGVYSLISISQSIFEVPTGIFSDLIGRKKTIILGSLASILALSSYALGGNFVMLAVGAILEGLARSFFSGNNEALIYDSLKEINEESYFGEQLGKISALFQVGLGASAFIGGFLADWNLQFLMWVSVIPQVFCFIIALIIKEPAIHSRKISSNIYEHLREALGHFKNNRKLRTLSLTTTLGYGVGQTMHQFVPVFYKMLWPTWAIGIPRTLSHIFAALGFYHAGKFIKKFKEIKLLISGSVFNRVLNFIAFIFPNPISPLLISGTSFVFGVNTVSQNSLLHKEFTDHQRATMESLNKLFANIFFAIFAFGFGSLADRIGPINSLIFGEILLIPLTIFYFYLFRRDKYPKKI